MVARDAAMWLDITDQYTEQHHKEWRAQKCVHDVNTLEHVTEIVYIGRLEDREDECDAAESREAEAQKLPEDCQRARALRQEQAMPRRDRRCPYGRENYYR